MSVPVPIDEPLLRASDHERWTRAGLGELTGPEHGPALGPPPGLVARVDSLTGRIAEQSAALGHPVSIDGLGALAVRARMAGLRRRGQVSCGGACHLVRAADGWFALSLNRPDDWALLPAWLGLPAVDDPGRWPAVHDRCADRPRDELVLRGAQLGLPIGALPHADRRDVPGRFGVIEHAVGTGAVGPSRPRPGRPLRVADLSSMWAGPLCGSVLAAAGAHVLKVESTTRPDGTRTGSPEFYELLNGAKEEVLLDLGTAEGVRRLETLLRSVDVVIESSRPRALRQLGLSAEDLLADAGGPSVWVSITGHGRDGTAGERVGFGDDAAVAGGLVQLWDGAPTFCGDAIADPLTGLTAAAATLDALARGQKVLLDVALSRVAAHFAGRGALG